MGIFGRGPNAVLEKEMAPHSSILAWRIPWTEEPSRLQSTEFNAVQSRFPFHSIHFSSHVFSTERRVAVKSEDYASSCQGRFGHASPGEVGE